MESANVFVPLRRRFEQRGEGKSFNDSLAEPLMEVRPSAAGSWGGWVNAFGQRLLVALLPAGEPKDGSDDVAAFLHQSCGFGAASLFPAQRLNDSCKVFAYVRLEAEAECDGGAL